MIEAKTYRLRGSMRFSAEVIEATSSIVTFQQRLYGYLGAPQTLSCAEFIAKYVVPEVTA